MKTAAAVALVAVLCAPAAFAVESTLAWDANPAEENVTSYCVYDNGSQRWCGNALEVVLDFPPGRHVLTVTAKNDLGLESDGSKPLHLLVPGGAEQRRHTVAARGAAQ